MNATALTNQQKRQLVYHLQCAVHARAKQWDHEREIERILDRDIHDDIITTLAAEVGYDADTINPRELTFIRLDNIEECLAQY